MKAEDIRQSFLDFFKSKEHQIVTFRSASARISEPSFHECGNESIRTFFLGDQMAPFNRATDTQKCIRAGGKHNDLEDVGFDTYHHTFFEMLGNWSFGNYFKKEAIEWAWELLVDRWNFPANRLYATVYKPEAGDPADFDQEAHILWTRIFESAGLDPEIHVVAEGKRTILDDGRNWPPCGPCSELHLDLTPEGNPRANWWNADSHRCIEIWNLVFIQFNADRDGNFSPLPLNTPIREWGSNGLPPSFRRLKVLPISPSRPPITTPMFFSNLRKLSELSGKSYESTPPSEGKPANEQEETDIASSHRRSLASSLFFDRRRNSSRKQ